MLLCQICKQREATVHYTRILNQQKVEMYVCEQCAREKNELKINIPNLISGIMGFNPIGELHEQPVAMAKCGKCGMTIQELNKTGMLGCTNCYKVFGDSIQATLKGIHGNVKHHGKIHVKISGKIKEANNLRLLKEDLQKCISREEYEQAAIIRDKIRALEMKAKKSGG